MSYRLQDLIWQKEFDTLSAAEKFVLMCLAFRAKDDGVCWPSVDGIARSTNLNAKTVRSALAFLETEGFITRKARPGAKTVYSLNIETIQGLSDCQSTTKSGRGTENGRATENGCEPLPETVGLPLPKTGAEHVREQEMNKEVVVPVPACEESALHPTIEDYGINSNEVEGTSTVTSKTGNPLQPRTLQGPSYIDPVPFDEIVAAYNRHMAHIGGKVNALDPAQTAAVVDFWECLVIELWKTKDDEVKTRAGALEQVENYFRHCAADGFINGTAKRKPEYKNWIAKFDWLIRESTLRRMLGGGYAPGGAGKKEGR